MSWWETGYQSGLADQESRVEQLRDEVKELKKAMQKVKDRPIMVDQEQQVQPRVTDPKSQTGPEGDTDRPAVTRPNQASSSQVPGYRGPLPEDGPTPRPEVWASMAEWYTNPDDNGQYGPILPLGRCVFTSTQDKV